MSMILSILLYLRFLHVEFTIRLGSKFAMINLDQLHYFFRDLVSHNSHKLFHSQEKYAHGILAQANMSSCNPTRTLVNTHFKFSTKSRPQIYASTQYQSLVGPLQYLTFTHP